MLVAVSSLKNGAKRTRTADPLHAMQVLYQLSYGPKPWNVINIIYLKISLVTSLISIVLYIINYVLNEIYIIVYYEI